MGVTGCYIIPPLVNGMGNMGLNEVRIRYKEYKLIKIKDMKSGQPNFEKLKGYFYNAFIKDYDKDILILLDTVKAGKLLPSFNKRAEAFKDDFNAWLDGIDIRVSSKLIDILVSKGKPVLGWMRDKRYVIDYNDRGFLDLIRLDSAAEL